MQACCRGAPAAGPARPGQGRRDRTAPLAPAPRLPGHVAGDLSSLPARLPPSLRSQPGPAQEAPPARLLPPALRAASLPGALPLSPRRRPAEVSSPAARPTTPAGRAQRPRCSAFPASHLRVGTAQEGFDEANQTTGGISTRLPRFALKRRAPGRRGAAASPAPPGARVALGAAPTPPRKRLRRGRAGDNRVCSLGRTTAPLARVRGEGGEARRRPAERRGDGDAPPLPALALLSGGCGAKAPLPARPERDGSGIYPLQRGLEFLIVVSKKTLSSSDERLYKCKALMLYS